MSPEEARAIGNGIGKELADLCAEGPVKQEDLLKQISKVVGALHAG